MVVEFIHKKLPEKIRKSWPLNRLINDVLILLVVILGWLVVDQRSNVAETQECIRDFLIEQSNSSQPRNEANAQADDALATAIRTIPPLLTSVLASSLNPDDPKLEADVSASIRRTNDAFTRFNINFQKLTTAREDFPLPPAPENLCKD